MIFTGPCPSDDYYHCKAENKCIDGRLKCDGIEQCDEGEDEGECSSKSCFSVSCLQTGPEVINFVSCSTIMEFQLLIKGKMVKNTVFYVLKLSFILLINIKMPTIVGILTFMSRISFRLS